ncbi:hypothetical protein O181_082669 [Austropuccinia psidii MF-1]|uniref:Uncharacterized protein n=1 Tax=Austropuccinia psidii MF-1 TaxID=1389203 RepID=A0A9Q3FPQ4_9BASI|nr:hypothetical protein [Austropuccinia psidii MF-1]
MVRQEKIETTSTVTRIIPESNVNSDHSRTAIITQNNQPKKIPPEFINLDISNTLQKAKHLANSRSEESNNPSSSSKKGYRHDYGRSKSVTEGQGADNSTRSLDGNLESRTEGLKQCLAEHRVPDPFRSVEKLHEFLADYEKVSGPSQHFQVTQWMASMDGKEKGDSFNSRMEGKNPPPSKKVPKTDPISSRSTSNFKMQPQTQNKGKGKASATKPYSQGYRSPNIQKDAMENVFQMARTMMVFQNKEEAGLKYQK